MVNYQSSEDRNRSLNPTQSVESGKYYNLSWF